jgi:hypothetical protein
VIENIFAGTSGNQRVETLFRELLQIPIPREVIDAVARQKDFTRRIRSDEGRGTRDRLKRDGIILLHGKNDRPTIVARGLPSCKDDEWMSVKLEELTP